MSLKYIQCPTLYLAGAGTTIGATSIVLTDLKDINGTILTMTDFGSKGFITLEPDTENAEAATFSGITANSNLTYTLTGVKTALSKSPYTETSGLTKQHSGGTKAVVTDTAAFWATFTNRENDETLTGKWSYAAVPTADTDLVNKLYVDTIAIAGAPDSSTSTKGITKLSTAPTSATSPIAVGDNDNRVSPVSLAAVTADKVAALAGTGTPNGTTGKYVTNDDTSATSSANKVYRQTAAGKIDATMLVGNLPAISGASLTGVAPTRAYSNGSGSRSSTGTETISHSLGTTPKRIIINAVSIYAGGSGPSTATWFASISNGFADSTGNSSTYITSGSNYDVGSSSSFSVYAKVADYPSGERSGTAVIQNFTATTFDIVWSSAGTMPNIYYNWAAEN